MMGTNLAEVVTHALRAPYTRVFQREQDGRYSCQVLEFPGCFSSGDTAEDAMANLDEAIELWVESELEQGHDIPEPYDAREFSGRLTLRLPPDLHRRAAQVADLQRISLNRLLAAAVAYYTGELAHVPVGAQPRDKNELIVADARARIQELIEESVAKVSEPGSRYDSR
jgi:predicted RNase H-like HicB family nuclease